VRSVVKKVGLYSFFISSKNTPKTTTHAPFKDPTSVHATLSSISNAVEFWPVHCSDELHLFFPSVRIIHGHR